MFTAAKSAMSAKKIEHFTTLDHHWVGDEKFSSIGGIVVGGEAPLRSYAVAN